MGTSSGIGIDLEDNCIMGHSRYNLRSDVANGLCSFYSSSNLCTKMITSSFDSPYTIFETDSFQCYSSYTQFRSRKSHSHSFGIACAQIDQVAKAFYNSSKVLTNYRFLPDAEGRFCCILFHNLIWRDLRLSMKEHLL